MTTQPTPLVVIDAANVVGSVPDGWWRDRRGAAVRLRDSLADLAANGMKTDGTNSDAVPDWACKPPLDVVLVVEGAARGIASTDTVRVVSAPRVGDDAIVELVTREGADRRCLVVTADRALRARVQNVGALTCGPHAVRAYRPPA